MNDKLEQTAAVIEKYALIPRGSRVLCALSGGADSVCLIHMLCALSKRFDSEIFAAHVNHGIRGAEADRDEEFVKEYCAKLGVKLFSEKADVPALAEKWRVSEETAGRRVRYEFFRRVCGENNISRCAVAHHSDDNCETVLLHFLRGSGLDGMCGMAYRNNDIIRPLLDLSRADIEDYCRSEKLTYVTDSTNSDTEYTRNRIRACLIPQLCRDYNPRFKERVSEAAELFREDKDALDAACDAAYSKAVSGRGIKIDVLKREPRAIQRRILRRFFGTQDMEKKHTDALLRLCEAAKSGSGCDIPGARVEISFGYLARAEDISEDFEYPIAPGESVYIPQINAEVSLAEGEELALPENARLVIRSRRAGDIFCPAGMTGRKKVKDYLTEKKIPKNVRASVPILECNGEIAAIGGLRRDRRFAGNGYKLVIKRGVGFEEKKL